MDDEVATTRLGIRSKGEELRALKADLSQSRAPPRASPSCWR